ncbi:MAG: HAMP domain-containing sensor histidine kinase [bacterium]|nr:HAMP domain-containing sensor histidine kinase [bacterium]
MNFRTRLLIVFLVAVALPMVVLALFTRAEMTGRLTAQYERRAASLIEVIESDLSREGTAIANSIVVLQRAAADDNRFRRAAVDRDTSERRYLLDYAGNAMRLAGLSMLQIQDGTGRIISSGHFRNEYDRMEPELPAMLGRAPDATALVRARAPDSPFLALVRLDSLRMGGQLFLFVAGRRVEANFLDRLARDDELSVTLVYPGGVLASGHTRDDDEIVETEVELRPVKDAIIRELRVPFVDLDRGELAVAKFRVAHQLTELNALRRSVDRWFMLALIVAVTLAALLIGWLSRRISQPLVELADKTSRIDLDRLDVDFNTHRTDEIGVLARVLDAMTGRIRTSAALIKDAERRATLGELARQVNHDIKNGLTPIRNIFRHLVDAANRDPDKVSGIIAERRGTLEASIGYLEDLASNYARLSRRGRSEVCNVGAIAEQVVSELRTHEANLNLERGEDLTLDGDPVAVRRIIENLVTNAVDSLDGSDGTVTVSTSRVAGENGDRIRISVADTGIGMTEETKQKVFDDFYTTKDEGTGLGLSIVRRLVMDLDGAIGVESEKGSGSCFTVDLPAESGRK